MWNGVFGFLEVWDDAPGGKVVDKYEEGGIEYVLVEFEKSPGKYYLFLA